ncbi:nucleotide-binding protein [Runella sp.]|uniref:nucleotide-binding protein n=1 Tax=Runella sp. TaxID=1960881 RepID=UPI003D0E076F
MKPRIFIGSSTEGLDIAYAIQENLEYDSNPTVWTQGIFELSSNALDDLIKALNNFDFGIFVFKPDDLTQIRTDKLNTVRDNVIFELGLFIGKLGKQRVFFVVPQVAQAFHLPTDLLGVTAGKYNNQREDGNLKAALWPFCSQVREKLKNFVYESLLDLEGESDKIKKIAIDKAPFWGFFLSAELLRARLISINRSYIELEKGLIFQRSKSYTELEFLQWFNTSADDLIRLVEIFKQTFEVDLLNACGGEAAGNTYEIKAAIDKIASICKELLAWEYELQGVTPPDSLKEIKELMKGWTKGVIDTINKYPQMIENSLTPENIEKDGEINIALVFQDPANMSRISQILDEIKLRGGFFLR